MNNCSYYNQITDEEAIIMMQALLTESTDENGNTLPALDHERTASSMQLIDDHLTLMSRKSLLTRKRGLKKQLEARLDLEIGMNRVQASKTLNNK